MKLRINFIYLYAAIILFTVLHLPCGNARSLASTANVLANTESTTKAASEIKVESIATNKTQNATIENSSNRRRINDTTAVTTLSSQTQEQLQTKTNTVITHVVRKRELEVTIPFDFHTTHMPCDLDVPNIDYIISLFPNHCIWVTNNRYQHEGFYRVYKFYQLEGHLFGQYYQRISRYETDPLNFEYAAAGP